MKKMMHLFICIPLFLFLGVHLNAQQTFVWNVGVSVTLPDDFSVTTNSNGEFDAIGDGMNLSMFVFEEDISLEEIEEATLMVATEIELTELDALQNVTTTTGFEGKYVAGYKDDHAVLLVGLIDPNSITNFFVVITFLDDDIVAQEDAFIILNSLSH